MILRLGPITLIFGKGLAMTLDQINAKLDDQARAIQDLAARMPQPGAATAQDLDAIAGRIDTNTAAVAALAPRA